jgi:hypothetical protein
MLRTLQQTSLNVFDIKDFEMNSDILLKSKSSNEITTPSIISSPYDTSKLNKLTNLSQELMDGLLTAVEPPDLDSGYGDDENSNTAADIFNDAKEASSGKTKPEFILAMIFKTIPIPLKIVGKFKTVAIGFKEMGSGIANLMKNLAILSAIFTMDSIIFTIHLFVYLFKLLLCSVTIISNFPKCVFYYAVNIFMIFILSCILSILFIIDAFLMLKYWTGISCIEAFMALLQYLEMADQFLYSTFSFHIIHYPDSVLNMCYRCSVMGDASGFQNALSNVFNDIFVRLPNEIGGPIGDALTGIGHIISFFDLS